MGKDGNRCKCVNPKCCSLDVIIVQTTTLAGGVRVRRRRCESCGQGWYTAQQLEERIEPWRLVWAERGGPIALRPLPESPENQKI